MPDEQTEQPTPAPEAVTVTLRAGTVIHVDGVAHRTVGDTIVAVAPDAPKAPKAAPKAKRAKKAAIRKK
jgi:hypothetical protein